MLQTVYQEVVYSSRLPQSAVSLCIAVCIWDASVHLQKQHVGLLTGRVTPELSDSGWSCLCSSPCKLCGTDSRGGKEAGKICTGPFTPCVCSQCVFGARFVALALPVHLLVIFLIIENPLGLMIYFNSLHTVTCLIRLLSSPRTLWNSCFLYSSPPRFKANWNFICCLTLRIHWFVAR